jgi:hypothetical protein
VFAPVNVLDTDPDFGRHKDDAGFQKIRTQVELNSKPCMTNRSARQFDFRVGEWDVEVSGQLVAVSRNSKAGFGMARCATSALV